MIKYYVRVNSFVVNNLLSETTDSNFASGHYLRVALCSRRVANV